MIRADNGMLTFAGVFRNIKSSTVPISKGPIGIAVEFIGEPGDLFKVSVEGNGVDMNIAEGTVEPFVFPYAHQQGSIIIAGEIGLQFAEPGTFDVILRSGEEVIHSNTYGAILIPEEGNDGS